MEKMNHEDVFPIARWLAPPILVAATMFAIMIFYRLALEASPTPEALHITSSDTISKAAAYTTAYTAFLWWSMARVLVGVGLLAGAAFAASLRRWCMNRQCGIGSSVPDRSSSATNRKGLWPTELRLDSGCCRR